jgi:protease-4
VPPGWEVGPAIAVITVEGDIVDGESTTVPLIRRHLAGDRTIIQAIEYAMRSDTVKAIVLRVNSPGGSAVASQHIWQALRRARKRKPVVVSLGDMAASGGYFVACAGDHIVAEPGTITGSIGIYTGKFDLSELLAKVGINTHTTARGKRATMDSSTRPYSAEERGFILARLQYYYREFLSAVGTGRSMTQDQVHEVARGRVWTGKQALERKLVDAIGGLQDAIEEARRRAGLGKERHVRLLVLPKRPRGILARLIKAIGSGKASESPIPRALQAQLSGIAPIPWYAESGEPLARLPYEVSWE